MQNVTCQRNNCQVFPPVLSIVQLRLNQTGKIHNMPPPVLCNLDLTKQNSRYASASIVQLRLNKQTGKTHNMPPPVLCNLHLTKQRGKTHNMPPPRSLYSHSSLSFCWWYAWFPLLRLLASTGGAWTSLYPLLQSRSLFQGTLFAQLPQALYEAFLEKSEMPPQPPGLDSVCAIVHKSEKGTCRCSTQQWYNTNRNTNIDFYFASSSSVFSFGQ